MDESTPFSTGAAQDQIEEVLAQIEQGGSRFPGMSYEEGIRDALEWVLGESDSIPYPES